MTRFPAALLASFLATAVWAGPNALGPTELPVQPVGVAATPLAPAPNAPAGSTLASSTLVLPPSATGLRPVALARRVAAVVTARVRALAGVGEELPSWPGRTGERLRLGRASWTLGKIAGEGGGSTVWDASEREHVVKILHPEARELPHYGDEAELLRALAHSDVPHARLLAASKDGSVMVKERLDGDRLVTLLDRGFDHQHREGWAELGARLLRARVTADLAEGNVVWERWRSRFALYDAGGVEAAGPGPVLRQLLTARAKAAGIEAGRLLAAIRGRLGPDSKSWADTLAALRASTEFAGDLAALEAYDGDLAVAPNLEFGASVPAAPFPDAVARSRAVVKALGYDPLSLRPRVMLHGDDPGKLNTQVFRLAPPGKPEVVVKIASWHIVRNELALRRVARRFFGRWLDVPSAFGVEAGFDSYLVMEHRDAHPSYGVDPLTREQRVALAVLVNAFGVWDVNQGNVLFPASGRPVLIDFEQALSPRGPHSRLPDERIAMEMPWMSRSEPNHVEDYQPAVRAWRALLLKPETRAAIRSDFLAAGFTEPESSALLALVDRNTADLDWTLQVDAEFVNQFVKRHR